MSTTPSKRIRSDVGPYTMVPGWLIKRVSSRALHVFAILGLYADRGTNESYPSRRTIALDIGAGTSVDTVDRALKELVEAQALEIESRRHPSGDRASNLYRLRFTAPDVGSRTDAATWPQDSAATPSRVRAAQNQNQSEPESTRTGDPYAIRTRTGTSTAAEPPPWTASEPLGEEIAASDGGTPQVLRKIAWERLIECFGDVGAGIGTRAAECPASVTALIEWLSGRAAELRIPASDEQIVRAAKSMWNAHADRTLPPAPIFGRGSNAVRVR